MSRTAQDEIPATPRAIVVVGSGTIPAGYALAIVCEARDVEGQPLTTGYAKDADLYYRTDAAVKFPAKVEVVTLGVDVVQDRFDGFSPKTGSLCVGPASPAYAAANLAWQYGYAQIDICGLRADEQARLTPYFQGLSTHPVAPAQVAVSFV